MPGVREALRELGVDELVDHDPRRRHLAREGVPDEGRNEDEAYEPGPDGHGPDRAEERRAHTRPANRNGVIRHRRPRAWPPFVRGSTPRRGPARPRPAASRAGGP